MIRIVQGDQRVVSSKYNTDVVVESNTNDNVLDNEDVPFLTDATDYAGSKKRSVSSMMYAGVTNKLQGEVGAFLGAKDYPITDRGSRSETHRTRTKLLYVKF